MTLVGGAGAAADLPALEPRTAAEIVEALPASGARVSVVNLWATWCVPCREEFPDLMRFHRDYRERGVRLVLVSSDFESEAEEARKFLASQGVDFASYLKNEPDQAFIDGFDPAWSGALPATFFYDAGGERRRSLRHPVTYDELVREIGPLLDDPSGTD